VHLLTLTIGQYILGQFYFGENKFMKIYKWKTELWSFTEKWFWVIGPYSLPGKGTQNSANSYILSII
jgi:hypothetical protein